MFRGQCAEFCGLQHAHMALLVTSTTNRRFQGLVAAAGAARAPTPPAVAPEQGEQLFVTSACAHVPHRSRGTPASGAIAARPHPPRQPPHARRRRPADATPDTLAAWIADPQIAKPGTNMPTIGLEPRQLNALVAYLDDAAMNAAETPRDRLTATALDALLTKHLGRRAGLLGLADHRRPQDASGDATSSPRSCSSCSAGMLALAHARAAGAPGKRADGPGPLQPDLHDARHDDDVPVRGAGDGSGRGLHRPADARHAQHRVSRASTPSATGCIWPAAS